MTNEISPPMTVGSMEGLGVIERAEWQRRYAARIMERAGWDECPAIAAAEASAEAHEESERGCGNSVVWWGGPSGADNTPEDAADEEMSYWDNDE